MGGLIMIKIGRITLALTVIAIGSIWLLSIQNPTLATHVSMYWPVVFIIYGLEVLGSSFFKQNKKLSIWLLVVSIALAFGVSNFMQTKNFEWDFVWSLDGLFANGVTEQVNLAQDITQETTVNVEVLNGRIEVLVSDDEQLHFIGNAIWQPNVEPVLRFEKSGTEWKLQAEGLISLTGKLLIPDDMKVLVFSSTNGSLQVNNLVESKIISAETTNGILELNGDNAVNVKSVNGTIVINDSTNLDVTNINGDITISSTDIMQLRVSGQQAEIDIQAASIENGNIQSINGDIAIKMLADNYLIQAKNVNGDIEIFNREYQKQTTVSQGSATSNLEVQTVNGDIEIFQQ